VSGADHLYRAFGVTVRSNCPLPGLSPAAAAQAGREVCVRVGERAVPELAALDSPPMSAVGMERIWRTGDGGRLLRYDDGMPAAKVWTMRVSPRGELVEVERTDGVQRDDMLQVVLSAGLATALQLAGVPLLHGCAVEVGGRAIVVLGASGAGKSTVAAALVAAGHALLSDDVAAVEPGTAPLVHPGAARLRIAPASARAVGWDATRLPRVFSTEILGDKLRVDLPAPGRAFCAEPRELAAIYSLGPRGGVPAGAPPEVATLPAAEVLRELLANSYRSHALDREQRDRLVPGLLRVAEAVPVRRVRVADDLGGLARLADTLAGDAMRQA
jgi:hypothetical protein